MPPLPPVPGVVKIRISGTFTGGTWANIFHVGTATGPITHADLVNLDSELNALANVYTNDGSMEIEGTLAEYWDLTSDSGATASISKSWPGSREGDANPGSACVVTSWPITRRYRGGHPRTYWPIGSVGVRADQQSWDTAFTAQVLADVSAFVEAVHGFEFSSGGTGNLGAVSYVNAGAPRAVPLFEPFNGVVVRGRICSQRRRLGKVGG